MYVKDFFALAASVMTRYEGLKDYKKGDRVIYDGKVYECTENHVSDVRGELQDESQIKYWELLIGKVDILEEWELNILYSVDDFVVYEDDIYKCIEKHRSINNFDDTKWEKVLVGGEIYEWQPDTFYLLDKKVAYKKSLYKCLVPHTSTENFEMDAQAGMWQVVVSGTPNIPHVSTKTDIVQGDFFRNSFDEMFIALQDHGEDELEYVSEKDATMYISKPIFNIGTEEVYQEFLTQMLGRNGHFLVGLNASGSQAPVSTGGTWMVECYVQSTADAISSLFLIANPNTSNSSMYVAHYKNGAWVQQWTEIGAGIKEWKPDTEYKEKDLVKNEKSIFVCILEHKSGSGTFGEDYAKYGWAELASPQLHLQNCDARGTILADLATNGVQGSVRHYYVNMNCTGLPNSQENVAYTYTARMFNPTHISLTATPTYSTSVNPAYTDAFFAVEYHCVYSGGEWSGWTASRPARKFIYSGVSARQTMLQVMSQLGSTTTADFYFMSNCSELPSSSYEWHVTCHYRGPAYASFVAYAVTRNSTYAQNTIYYGQLHNGTFKGWYSMSDFLGWEWRRTVMPHYNTNLDYKDNMRITMGQYPSFYGSLPSSIFSAIGLNVCQNYSESSGIHFDGETIVMYSPGDGGCIVRYHDEDESTVNSIAHISSSNGSWQYRSDRRCKENIDYTPYEDILDKIDSCQPCHFTAKKKNSLEDAHYTIQALEVAGDVLYEYLDDDKKETYENADEYIEKEITAQERRIARLEQKQAVIQYGVIAQEVAEIFPDCVEIDSNGYYSVDYSKFGLYAIEGIKELHKKVKDLECENETLQAKNEELELRLAAIEAKLGL